MVDPDELYPIFRDWERVQGGLEIVGALFHQATVADAYGVSHSYLPFVLKVVLGTYEYLLPYARKTLTSGVSASVLGTLTTCNSFVDQLA